MKKDHLNTAGFNLWQTIREETEAAAAAEPMLASFLHQTVLRHESLDSVLSYHLSSKLGSPIMDVRALFEIYQQALGSDEKISKCVEADLKAIYERDPACDEYTLPLLYFKGFHAIQAHRINHWLYLNGRKTLAYFLQNRMSEVFGVDIHPAAHFGHGLMLDHATGFVAGETAVLGNNISILRLDIGKYPYRRQCQNRGRQRCGFRRTVFHHCCRRTRQTRGTRTQNTVGRYGSKYPVYRNRLYHLNTRKNAV